MGPKGGEIHAGGEGILGVEEGQRRRTGCKARRCGLCRYGCGGEGGGEEWDRRFERVAYDAFESHLNAASKRHIISSPNSRTPVGFTEALRSCLVGVAWFQEGCFIIMIGLYALIKLVPCILNFPLGFRMWQDPGNGVRWSRWQTPV